MKAEIKSYNEKLSAVDGEICILLASRNSGGVLVSLQNKVNYFLLTIRTIDAIRNIAPNIATTDEPAGKSKCVEKNNPKKLPRTLISIAG